MQINMQVLMFFFFNFLFLGFFLRINEILESKVLKFFLKFSSQLYNFKIVLVK